MKSLKTSIGISTQFCSVNQSNVSAQLLCTCAATLNGHSQWAIHLNEQSKYSALLKTKCYAYFHLEKLGWKLRYYLLGAIHSGVLISRNNFHQVKETSLSNWEESCFLTASVDQDLLFFTSTAFGIIAIWIVPCDYLR